MSKQLYTYLSEHNQDPILERRTCPLSGEKFAIFASEQDLLKKIAPTIAGKKITIPLPQYSPKIRQQQRYTFRNFSKLYKNTCAATAKPIITMYRDPYTIYSNDFRRSDNRNAVHYGRDFDPTQSFFQQRKDLFDKVPKYATHNLNCNNSQYCNMAANSNNCYLVFGCIGNENCSYGHIVRQSQQSLDCTYSKYCELCYECIDCYQCYQTHFSQDCQSCKNCYFTKYCQGSSDCLCCIGLTNKQYCIFNKQYTKEEYHDTIKNINFSDPSVISAYYNQRTTLENTYIHVSTDMFQSEQCSGNYIITSNNCQQCFDTVECENIMYGDTIARFSDSLDVSYSMLGGSLCYQTLFTKGSNILRSSNCQDECNTILYCDNCFACSHCFGCVGLRNQSYCIFNKQYTKEERETTTQIIIEHMQTTKERGQFFPTTISPFAYNESIAQTYFPLKESEAVAQGYTRFHEEIAPISVDKIIKGEQLPGNIDDVPDDILGQAIICSISNKPFRVTATELAFYRQQKLPLPRFHPEERNRIRLSRRNKRDLLLRKCDKSGKTVISVYGEDAPFAVYSLESYQQMIFG